MKLKGSVIKKLTYGAGSQPIEFEDWLRITRISLGAKHSLLVRWWDATCASARDAYDRYLSLSPLQRSSIRPTGINQYDEASMQCEHYMFAHVLEAMPQHIERV